MAFLTKSQVAKNFGISPTTVNNWVKLTEKNKLNLQTAKIGNKTVILESQHNRDLIQSLKLKGKKHITQSSKIVVDADPKLYEIFSKQQLTELISSLTSRSEIPYKFSYLDQGAVLWNEHYEKSTENKNNFVSKEYQLIIDNLGNITNRLKKYKKINIIDIGCGNGLPVIPIIKKLISEGFEVSYTALDISTKMLEIDRQEFLKVFPNIEYKSYAIDCDKFNISEILFFGKNVSDTNILLYLGGTLGNQSDVGRFYANLRDSMGLDDFLIVSEGISNNLPKNYITQPNQFHAKRTTWILDFLGLENLYSTNILDIFDPIKKQTTRKIEILKDVIINLKIENKLIKINLAKGEKILVFSFYWYEEKEIISEVVDHGFAIDQFNTNHEASCALMMVRPRKIK